jgi:hypothetical protein
MKITYIGANHRVGKSAKTGRSYDMARLLYAIPDSDSTKPDNVYRAHGHRVIEMDMVPSALSQFASCKPFTEVDITVEPVPENPSRNQVTGVVGK